MGQFLFRSTQSANLPKFLVFSAGVIERDCDKSAKMNSSKSEIVKSLKFVDEESFIHHAKGLLKRECESEKELVLNSLSTTYKEKFRTIGFCHEQPIQILSPYDVPPGEWRKRWFEEYMVRTDDRCCLISNSPVSGILEMRRRTSLSRILVWE